MAISFERFTTLFLNWWEITEKDMTLSEMEDLCKDIGMTRGEFIELVSRSGEFITKSGWTPDPNTVRKSERQVKAERQNEDEDKKISEPTDRSTRVPDYFRLIEMLDKVDAQYRKLGTNGIELHDDCTAVDFYFNENFELVSVEW